MAQTGGTSNTGIMHWMVAPGRVACNAKRAIMGVPYEAFWDDPKPCKRCMAKALVSRALADKALARSGSEQ